MLRARKVLERDTPPGHQRPLMDFHAGNDDNLPGRTTVDAVAYAKNWAFLFFSFFFWSTVCGSGRGSATTRTPSSGSSISPGRCSGCSVTCSAPRTTTVACCSARRAGRAPRSPGQCGPSGTPLGWTTRTWWGSGRRTPPSPSPGSRMSGCPTLAPCLPLPTSTRPPRRRWSRWRLHQHHGRPGGGLGRHRHRPSGGRRGQCDRDRPGDPRISARHGVRDGLPGRRRPAGRGCAGQVSARYNLIKKKKKKSFGFSSFSSIRTNDGRRPSTEMFTPRRVHRVVRSATVSGTTSTSY